MAEQAPAAAPEPPAPKKPQVKKRGRTSSIDASIDRAGQAPLMASDDSDFASFQALTILRATTAMKEVAGATSTEPLFAIAGAMAREEAFGRFLQKMRYPV